MKATLRYTDEMLAAVARQSFPSMVFNSVIRGVGFMVIIQLLSVLGTGQSSGILQILVLALIFTLFIFAFDLIEKYWAQDRLSKRT